MSAVLLPFPRCRDVAFVRRHAEHMSTCRTPASAERYLQAQLRIQAGVMFRRGLDEAIVVREVLALERAIRMAMGHDQATPGGVA